MKIKHLFLILSAYILLGACTSENNTTTKENDWKISAIPSSIRLDPTTNKMIEGRFVALKDNDFKGDAILEKNWVYDGEQVSLHAARGEYISFQLVLTNHTDTELSDIKIEFPQFTNGNASFGIDPELFLEWAVEVKNPSTGYPKASLGKGWYPDALIPFKFIQTDSSKVRRWTYPFWLPDFNNRIDDQKSLIVWIDQYVPFEKEKAMPGTYQSVVSVTIDEQTQEIPVRLNVWDFAIPNQNKLGASLQHEGFVSGKPEEEALEIYQLMKRNRMSVMEPTYHPGMEVGKDGKVKLDWSSFDERLEKYFTGKAFTSEYGYAFGPGYGEPIENFVLPFDVYGKHGTAGWPDIGTPDVERNPENTAIYIDAIKQVRSHLQQMLDPEKTDLTVYLNGLDESYFKEAWSRMVYFGDLFHEYYPESHFRIDGGYSEEAMAFVQNSIDYWGSHSINYNIDKVRKYQEMGIKDWLYGPMLYESEVNSWVGSSTFIDLPLVNDRAISWSCWKYGIHSWISWGIGAGWRHAWYDPETWKDAYKAHAGSDPEFPYKKINGNGMLIYSPGIVPNVDDACPSIRLKAYRDGIQEYEYMRLLSELDGNRDRADQIMNEIIYDPFGDNAIGVLDVWTFDAAKWDQARIKLGELIHEASQQ